MSTKRAVIVAGAPLRWDPATASLALETSELLAADGGANSLAKLGLRPRVVIGDLDSISPQTRAWLGEDVMVHRPDQNHTDLDKALSFAFDELHLDEVTVLAALGGRSDHDHGNLGLLARWGLGHRLVYLGDGYRVLAVTGDAVIEAVPGEIWSFWSYDSRVRVTIGGVRWPLQDAAIDTGRQPSISNEATEDRVTITATGGAVVVYRHLAPPP